MLLLPSQTIQASSGLQVDGSYTGGDGGGHAVTRIDGCETAEMGCQMSIPLSKTHVSHARSTRQHLRLVLSGWHRDTGNNNEKDLLTVFLCLIKSLIIHFIIVTLPFNTRLFLCIAFLLSTVIEWAFSLVLFPFIQIDSSISTAPKGRRRRNASQSGA